MTATTAGRIQGEYEKEVRLAVVMYGGVSLAIYINGVAQEFLRLVQSTAPGAANVKLTGTAAVYRKLAWLMGGEGRRYSEVQDAESVPSSIRFLIDIISGTSAGGINGVFLGKALANGQDMEDLKDLWVSEGDISLLINDRESKVKGLPLRKPPESLLNSQRMYVKLLDALSGMDRGADGKILKTSPTSPYVDELDLFLTASDIRGVAIPLRLSDQVVFERRHRNSFHFSYCADDADDSQAKPCNDFCWSNNPFLAYASRCTSSFPFAFEPMKLADIDGPLDRYPDYQGADFRSGSDSWKKFYADYENLPEEVLSRVPFTERSFGDGGYLDNKPFSYSIEALSNRQANIPVDRKLIYIEPSPDHPEFEAGALARPDVLHNIASCLVTLPRYETIRDDLQRVLDRNRLLARLSWIINGLQRDIADDYPWIPDQKWREMDLNQLSERGRGYLAYHRLLVSAVTDDLADTVTRVSGFDSKCDHALAIRCLVRAWRKARFTDYHDNSNRETLSAFVMWFDLGYPLRQLAFLREKIDAKFKEKGDLQELRDLKTVVNKAYRRLCNLRSSLRSRTNSPLILLLEDIGISHDDLDSLLMERRDPSSGASANEPSEKVLEGCERRARDLLNADGGKVAAKLDKVAAHLRFRILHQVGMADAKCRKALGLEVSSKDPRLLERDSLAYYYMNYDLFDMVSFPILYETGAGEIDNIEVLRISPEDADSLIDEKTTGCRKLAGSTLWHFGAFMERRWRENDILWGRLDGAERLIRAMLPDHPDARRLIGEAQAAIVLEALDGLGDLEKYDLLAESMMRTREGKPDADALSDFLSNLKTNAPSACKELDLLINERRLRDHYQQKFRTQSRLCAEDTLRCAARASVVVGRMLEGLADRYGAGKKYAAVAVRIGRIFWGLVEVSLPQSMENLLFRHWLFLLYLFEILLIVGGALFHPGVQSLGWKALLATLFVHAVVIFFNSMMGGKPNRWLRWLGYAVVAALLSLSAYHIKEDAEIAGKYLRGRLQQLVERSPLRRIDRKYLPGLYGSHNPSASGDGQLPVWQPSQVIGPSIFPGSG